MTDPGPANPGWAKPLAMEITMPADNCPNEDLLDILLLDYLRPSEIDALNRRIRNNLAGNLRANAPVNPAHLSLLDRLAAAADCIGFNLTTPAARNNVPNEPSPALVNLPAVLPRDGRTAATAMDVPKGAHSRYMPKNLPWHLPEFFVRIPTERKHILRSSISNQKMRGSPVVWAMEFVGNDENGLAIIKLFQK